MDDNKLRLGVAIGAIATVIGLWFYGKSLDNEAVRIGKEEFAKKIKDTRQLISDLRSDPEAYANFNVLFTEDLKRYSKYVAFTPQELETIRFFCEAYVMAPEEFFAFIYRSKINVVFPNYLQELGIKDRESVYLIFAYERIFKKLQGSLPTSMLDRLLLFQGRLESSKKGKKLLKLMERAKKIYPKVESGNSLQGSIRKAQGKTRVVLKTRGEKTRLVTAKANAQKFKPRFRA